MRRSFVVLFSCAVLFSIHGVHAQEVTETAVVEQPKPPIAFSNLVLRDDENAIGFVGADYRVFMLEAMRAEGLNAVGAENLVFGKDKSAKAEYVLGGTVREWKCYSERDKRGCCRIGIGWELLDVATDQVVYRVMGRHGACHLGLFDEKTVVKRMLVGALRTVTNRANFQKALVDKHDDVTTLPPPAASFTRCKARPLKMSSSAEPALDATVLIKAGNGHGSGFLLTNSGLVLTAAHVATHDKLTVVTRDGSSYAARLLRISKASDVALLAIDPAAAPHPLGCLNVADSLQPAGAEVYAIGAPSMTELAFSLTRGIVSGTPIARGMRLLQTDAPVSPGNSGGPLVDARGQVVAIVSSKLAGEAVEGVAFGIPIDTTLRALGLSASTTKVDELEKAPTLVLPSEAKSVTDDVADPVPLLISYVHVDKAFVGARVWRAFDAAYQAEVSHGDFMVGFGGFHLDVLGLPTQARDSLVFRLTSSIPPPEVLVCGKLTVRVNGREIATQPARITKGRMYVIETDVPVTSLDPLQRFAPGLELQMCSITLTLAPTQITKLQELLKMY